MNKKILVVVCLLLLVGTVFASSIYCSSWFCIQVEQDNSISGIIFADPLINHMRPELKEEILGNCFSDPLCYIVSSPKLIRGEN